MDYTRELCLLVLSCDAYRDLWDDFFNLRDIYWNDCPYKWYLVTESEDYIREGVEVIQCGKELNWIGRFREAVTRIDAKYFGIYLEDYFISSPVNNSVINELLHVMENNNVSMINVGAVFNVLINMRDKQYFQKHLFHIPNHMKYGISASSAIWNKEFLLEKLGNIDGSAWQFEINMCHEALTDRGYGGVLLCDDRKPFNVSVHPVVIQGQIYPKARKYFKRVGYEFITQRPNMALKQVMIYNLKCGVAGIKVGRRFLKWVGEKVFKLKFFTEG